MPIQQLSLRQDHRCLRLARDSRCRQVVPQPLLVQPIRCRRQVRDSRCHQVVPQPQPREAQCLQQARDLRLRQAVPQARRPELIRCLRPVQDSRLHQAVVLQVLLRARHQALDSVEPRRVVASRVQPVEARRLKVRNRRLARRSSRPSLS